MLSKTASWSGLCSLAFLMFGLGSVSVMMPETACAGGQKLEVCHIPPGNPDNYHTITISDKALPKHQAHLDLTGACDDNCATFCDDGDACTVDDTGDCETFGCPVDRQPVDCDDGDMCTIDSCDSVFGCDNTPKDCSDGDMCTVDTCDPLTGVCEHPPVSCPEGFICDPETGGCVAEPVACPCFLLEDLQNEGQVFSFTQTADSVMTVFFNSTNACAGGNSECVFNDAQNPTGCYYFGDFDANVGDWLDQRFLFTSAEEDAACKDLLNLFDPDLSAAAFSAPAGDPPAEVDAPVAVD